MTAPSLTGARGLVCRHPKALRHRGGVGPGAYDTCECGHIFDPAIARRGRLARNRGNSAERTLAKRHGGKRVGQFGGAEDVIVSDLFVEQSKHGASYFSERYWSWLSALPRTEGRIPILVVGDGSPGRHVRRLVVMDERDWLALHGTAGPE